MTAKCGALGQQPAKKMINPRAANNYASPYEGRGGHIADACRELSKRVGYEIPVATLRRYLDGYNQPPAEIKIGLAEILGLPVEACWSAEVLERNYVGPRGFRILRTQSP